LAAHTPPPSPPGEPQAEGEDELQECPKIDTEGINDDVVVATIKLLEETGNRPLMLKELAAVLCTQLAVVERYVSLSLDLSFEVVGRTSATIDLLACLPLLQCCNPAVLQSCASLFPFPPESLQGSELTAILVHLLHLVHPLSISPIGCFLPKMHLLLRIIMLIACLAALQTNRP
jgi:predicted metal-dependent RNase